MKIDFWHIRLCGSLADAAKLHGHLDSGLRTRAGRLAHPEDWRRFVLRHSAYQRILQEALCLDQAQPVVKYSQYGKPFVPGKAKFSWSVSGDYSILGIASEGEIGVDLEKVEPFPVCTRVLELVAAQDEREWLFGSPTEELFTRFLRLWVRKEAVLKAKGIGLLQAPSSVSAAFVERVFDKECGTSWLLQDIVCVEEPFLASFACSLEGDEPEVIHHQFTSAWCD